MENRLKVADLVRDLDYLRPIRPVRGRLDLRFFARRFWKGDVVGHLMHPAGHVLVEFPGQFFIGCGRVLDRVVLQPLQHEVQAAAIGCLCEQKRHLGQVVDVGFVSLPFSPLCRVLPRLKIQGPRKSDNSIAHVFPLPKRTLNNGNMSTFHDFLIVGRGLMADPSGI